MDEILGRRLLTPHMLKMIVPEICEADFPYSRMVSLGIHGFIDLDKGILT